MNSAPPSRAGQIALFAEFTAKPGREEDVAGLLAELTRKVRTEPGNLVFDPHRLESNPAEFFVYEVYADPAAFDAHLTADYGAAFNTALGDLITGEGSDLTRLRPLNLAHAPNRPDVALTLGANVATVLQHKNHRPFR